MRVLKQFQEILIHIAINTQNFIVFMHEGHKSKSLSTIVMYF